MNGRFAFRGLAIVVLLVVLGALGVAAYNAGLNAGVAVAIQQGVESGQPVVVPYGYGPHWHGGIGFFGILFWIIGFFLVIGLLRAIFGMGRGRHGSWGRDGWGKGYYGGPGGPGGYGGGEDRVAEWHRELHRREATGETGSTNPNATNPSSSS